MSRPMALALVLILLFLTSQSDWKAARSQQEAAQAIPRQQRLEDHQEKIKDTIFTKMTRELHDLEEENTRLKMETEDLRKQLSKCQGSTHPTINRQELIEAYNSRMVHGKADIPDEKEQFRMHERHSFLTNSGEREAVNNREREPNNNRERGPTHSLRGSRVFRGMRQRLTNGRKTSQERQIEESESGISIGRWQGEARE